MSGSQSQGPSSGMQGGRASGDRPAGTPEPVTFKPEKLKAQRLQSGQTVAVHTTDGPSVSGEATIKKNRAVVEAIQERSKEIQKEPLPPEYRGQAERFYQLLMEGDGGGD